MLSSDSAYTTTIDVAALASNPPTSGVSVVIAPASNGCRPPQFNSSTLCAISLISLNSRLNCINSRPAAWLADRHATIRYQKKSLNEHRRHCFVSFFFVALHISHVCVFYDSFRIFELRTLIFKLGG